MAVLVSYYYLNPSLLDMIRALKSRQVPTMLDSGAFSAFSLGKPVGLDDYVSFCKDHAHNFTQYVQLDKIRDAATSRVWLQKMYDAGLKPMPVFTVGDDEKEFDWFYSFNKRICVAGNPTSKSSTWGIGNSGSFTEAKTAYEARFERFWRMAKGDIKMHGLSFTRGIAAWKSRCWSVDSSTWANGQRYGKIMMFSQTKGCNQHPWSKYAKAKFLDLTDPVANYFVKCGVKVEDLMQPEASQTALSMISILSCEAWLSYAINSRARGVTFFFAAASIETMAGLAIAAKHRLHGGGVNWPAVKNDIPRVRELLARKDKSEYIAYAADALAKHIADPQRCQADA